MRAREVEARVKRGEARACEGLAHAFVADAVLEAVGELGGAEQQRAEREAECHPNRLVEQSHLDRPAHEEEARNGERDASAPDRQQAAEDLLEIETRTEAVCR